MLALAACARLRLHAAPVQPTAPAQPALTAAQLRIGITGDEATLTPYTYVTGYPGWNLLLLQYDTLYQVDLDGVAQPWLAIDSSTSDDGLTVTLNLRQDVAWHDGEPFTAADVAIHRGLLQAAHAEPLRTLRSTPWQAPQP